MDLNLILAIKKISKMGGLEKIDISGSAENTKPPLTEWLVARIFVPERSV